jgi:hypothetical protein
MIQGEYTYTCLPLTVMVIYNCDIYTWIYKASVITEKMYVFGGDCFGNRDASIHTTNLYVLEHN